MPFLMRKDSGAASVCGLDILSQKDVIEPYLEKNKYSVEMYYTNDVVQDIVSEDLDNLLKSIKEKHSIDAVIISTEPLMHFKYAKWALENNLNVLMDKPISTERDVSTDLRKAKKLVSDFEELATIYRQKKEQGKVRTFSLMSQRRFHAGYLLARNKIKEVFEKTNCPVTSIQISHSDGQWRFPTEIIEQDYHPYNQGYGKASHSGYHSLDMVNWFVEAALGGEKNIDNADVFSSFVRPNDFIQQLTLDDYRKLFPNFDEFNKYSEEDFTKITKGFGELDVFSNIVFKQGSTALCLGSVNLIHNGFSQRNWVAAAGRDLYKGNGRIRQESHFIEQGPFQSIALLSYQSEEINPNNNNGLHEFGGEWHFDIHVFRNSKLFPEYKSHERFSISDLAEAVMPGYSRGHQEDARISCIIDFIDSVRDNRETQSDILSHERGTRLLAAVYESEIKRSQGENPVVNIKFNNPYAD